MNSKLLLLLLSRRDSRGFAIALSLAMGLVMVLVGITLVMRSTGHKTNAQAYQVSAEGLSLSEVGITRFQNLLNDNRYAALYDDCVSRNTGTGLCEDAGTTASWDNLVSVPKFLACNTPKAIDLQAIAYDLNWVNVDNKGQYRLIRYQYQPDPGVPANTAPGKGILTLEGRAKQNNDLQVATSRIVVEIPILASEPENDPIPGVWLAAGGTGSNTIQGDVLLNDCSTNTSSITVSGTDPVTGVAYAAKHTAMQFPELPSLPSITSLGTLSGQDYTFPRVGDTPVTKTITDSQGNTTSYQVYEYVIDKIDLQAGSHTLEITPGQRVTFHLTGSLEKGGEIRHSCTDASGNPITGCKPTNFQIYGHGTAPLTGSDYYKVCTTGNKRVEAFIFAPSYVVGTAGTGGGQGGIKGSVWANNWSNSGACGSATSNTAVVQTARWDEIGLTPKNMPPKLSSISSWQRLER